MSWRDRWFPARAKERERERDRKCVVISSSSSRKNSDRVEWLLSALERLLKDPEKTSNIDFGPKNALFSFRDVVKSWEKDVVEPYWWL